MTALWRADVATTLAWLRWRSWRDGQVRALCRWRWWILAYAVTFSALDLALTQHALFAVAGLTGDQPAEANPVMAPIVLSWWGWPVRVGVPLAIGLWHIRPRRIMSCLPALTIAALLYAGVVTWNVHIVTTRLPI